MCPTICGWSRDEEKLYHFVGTVNSPDKMKIKKARK